MSHWYDKDGNPHHFVPKKSGEGTRSTTIKDARENGWLPSVSGILQVMSKPQLERWKMVQACTAVLTAPRGIGEGVDAFMNRVLFEEKEGEQEAKIAADRGTAIHDAISNFLNDKPFDPVWKVYVEAIRPIISALGKIEWSEKVLVGDGYAGRGDLCLRNPDNLILLDFKTASKLPDKGSWDDHRLQTSAYAATIHKPDRHVLTGNIYLSTKIPGETAFFVQEDWEETYEQGFLTLLKHWQWANKYCPGGKP